MKFDAAGRSRDLEIDMTSMIDMVFLLNIFFLIATVMLDTNREPLDLPKQSGEGVLQEAAAQRGTIVINVKRDGSIVADGKPFDVPRLLAHLGAELRAVTSPDDLKVLVRADQNATLRQVNDLAQGLEALGLRSWRLGTEIPPSGVEGGEP